MNEHAEKVVNHLERQADELRALANKLRECMGMDRAAGQSDPRADWAQDTARKTPALVRKHGWGKPRKNIVARTGKVANGEGESARMRAIREVAEGRAKLAKLREPFTTQEIIAATGLDKKRVYGLTLYLKRLGWIAGERGEFRRTAKWGGTSPLSPLPKAERGTGTPPGHEGQAAGLTEKLQRALQARDAARSQGLEKIANVHQAEVERLEAARAAVE
jgi:hypothetical protein